MKKSWREKVKMDNNSKGKNEEKKQKKGENEKNHKRQTWKGNMKK